ncbi:pentatricopeptide repeat-containing protein At5g61370, mitochondrial [Macadamia integrifolia]|uniref:pentatricopeptide repeat-containing protein At5g61370, mitochondrial n=1 Tax=Macadamia integrifolia TaxID=60698 RepID=UPI001C4E8B55|nr:pentatricopeptide repeat-containing protein At5g61370, mitochondrial [Macadamia integrifolia]XP_042497846.1 pentatricopeptide repeat-containing protein At5g61370, mitochondrial [Macadamia integrifolia]XP_042497848.1 pentatricopeptide repeat-containing protein At5g61370, mitochondrial [Macadamia integrifolia]XP_042497849.1 pentatricopeptide repeat-containing protein At5g61370, mitochondrial [Macadamia integrifolia]XP_042497850.1 pentatricopeptide repeat-containing protein At5g61370, mitochond
MLLQLGSKLYSSLLLGIRAPLCQHLEFSFFSTTSSASPISPDLQEICHIVSSGIGGLDELESSLDRPRISITPTLVAQVIDACKDEAPSRRLLRFFTWSRKNLNCKLGDEEFNHAIRVFADKKDVTAMDILISDLRMEQRKMEEGTFSLVAETLVKLGREDEAVGLFKNLEKFKCSRDGFTVNGIVQALCTSGHARKAEGVVWHHKSKISGVEPCIYKNLLYGWCVHGNVREARRILKEMKLFGVMPDLFCYNTLLRCLCKRNLKFNPSALVPEATSLMIEMRSNGVLPNVISFNILLSCLGRTRRVKEACRVLYSMKKSGCHPNWVSFYLVVRVLYLTGRFGRGNQIVDEMIKEGFIPEPRFYYDLIGVLCGVERVNHALDLLERMKKSFVRDCGPVYDLLIAKLCRGGEFERGMQLWDEAVNMGIALHCSSDVLDPSITEVFKKTKRREVVNLNDRKELTADTRTKRKIGKKKDSSTRNKDKKKNASVT